jgi:protein TonB
LESQAEEAEIIPPPPPPTAEKPEEKPAPKPKPKPKSAPRPSQETGKEQGENVGPSTGQVGSGRGGIGGGSGQGNPNAMAAYKTQIKRRLERHKKYPPAARREKLQGTVSVRFTIARDGRVISSQIVKSSGHPILDDEASGLIRRVDPFPAFPKELSENTISLTAPIQFNLR